MSKSLKFTIIIVPILGLLLPLSCKNLKITDPSSQIKNSDTAVNCIDQTFEKLAIDLNMSSDPQLMNSILKDDMNLDDFEQARKALGSALTQNQPMGPMLERLRISILEKHPAVYEFLCEANTTNLISEITLDTHKATINLFLADFTTGSTGLSRFYDMTHSTYLNLHGFAIEPQTNMRFNNEQTFYLIYKILP